MGHLSVPLQSELVSAADELYVHVFRKKDLQSDAASFLQKVKRTATSAGYISFTQSR